MVKLHRFSATAIVCRQAIGAVRGVWSGLVKLQVFNLHEWAYSFVIYLGICSLSFNKLPTYVVSSHLPIKVPTHLSVNKVLK